MAAQRRPIKSEDHHWWPQGLARRWADENGVVHQMLWDGRVIPQSNTRNFGFTRNAHHIRLANARGEGSPWDESIEKQFSQADGAFPSLAAQLDALTIEDVQSPTNLRARFRPLSSSEDDLRTLILCALSLVVRSPRFRNSIRLTAEHYRKRFGLADPTADKNLIAANLRNALDLFVRHARGSGKFAIFDAGDREFIFGDGFFHNYTGVSVPPMNPRFIVPITPKRALLWASPQSYPTHPRIVGMRLKPGEVSFINETIMIYSCDSVFFRSQPPQITEAFSRRQFLQYERNKHRRIDDLIDATVGASD